MQLISATAYSDGYALLEFEAELISHGSGYQELTISDVPGQPSGTRVTVALADAFPASDLAIVDCKMITRDIPMNSWMESGDQNISDAYAKVQKSMRCVMEAEKERNLVEAEEETLSNLIKNFVCPKVLIAGRRSAEQPLVAENLSEKFTSTTSLLGAVAKSRKLLAERMIECQTKTARAREEASGAQENLVRLAGECGDSSIGTRDNEPEGLSYFQQWFQKSRTKKIRDIRVNYVSSGAGLKSKLRVEYLVTGASWSPSMNCKLSGSRLEKCTFDYSVTIKQKTGIDWKDIAIYLTNGDPHRRQDPPAMKKSFVDILPAAPAAPAYAPVAPQFMSFGARKLKLGCPNLASARGSATLNDIALEIRPAYGNLKLRLPASTNIPSGPSEQKIVLSRFSLDAKLFHHIIPDAEKKAYRALLITNTSDWTINNNEAMNVYVQGSLIGTTNLPRAIVRDSRFVLYAGVDDLIEITDLGDRETKSKSGNFLGNSQKKSSNSQIVIRNNHESGEYIDLIVSNKFPESKNQQVVVSLAPEVCSKAAKNVACENDLIAVDQHPSTDLSNTKTGCYIQHRLLKAGEVWQNAFGYTVSYPQNENIRTWSELVK